MRETLSYKQECWGQANSVTEGAKAAAFIMLTNSVLYISQLHSFTKSCKVLILTEV